MLVTTSHRLYGRTPGSVRGTVTGWSTRDAPVRPDESSLATERRRARRWPLTQAALPLPKISQEHTVQSRTGTPKSLAHLREFGLGRWWKSASCYDAVVSGPRPGRVGYTQMSGGPR